MLLKQQQLLAAWLVYIIISSGSLAGPAAARRAMKQHYVEALHSFLHRPFLRERNPAMPEHIHLQQQQMLEALHRQHHQDFHNMVHKKQQTAAAGASGTASGSTAAAATADSSVVTRGTGNMTDTDVLHAQRAKWPEGYVAVCAVVKDQNRDLRYWIEYHRWLGVGKFYIMDHNSTLPAMMVLWDYIQSGVVDYQYFVGKPRARPIFTDTNQYRAYQGCLLQHFRQHRWLAFIDIDEFFVLPPQHGQPFSAWQAAAANSSTLPDAPTPDAQQQLPGAAAAGVGVDAALQTQLQPPQQPALPAPDAAAGMQYDIVALAQASAAALVNNDSSSGRALSSWGSNRRPNLALFLAGYERHAALGVNWVMFGSSGLQQRPPAGPMASYSACVPQDNQENTHVKVVANTGGVLGLGMTPHEILPRPGRTIVDVDGVPFKGPKTPHTKWHKLVLHHYVLKSRAEFAGKHARGSGAGNVKGWEFFDYVDSVSNSSCSWGQGISKAFFASRPRLRPPKAGHPCSSLRSKQVAAAAAGSGGGFGAASSTAEAVQQQPQPQSGDAAVDAGGSISSSGAGEVADESAVEDAGSAYAEQD